MYVCFKPIETFVQILNWNGLENVWQYVRTICTTQFGDTSFNSFVKMLIADNQRVIFTEEMSFLLYKIELKDGNHTKY